MATLTGYEAVKALCRAACRAIDAGGDGALPRAHSHVLDAVDNGATSADLSNLLGPARMRMLREWSRRQKNGVNHV